MITTFLVATLTSGYVWANDNNNDGGEGDGGGGAPAPTPSFPVPVYLAIYPDAPSWKGPLIIAYIGTFLSLPLIGPVTVMQNRVSAHWKRQKEAKKDAVEMQGMDRA
jgi:hypothetical protein